MTGVTRQASGEQLRGLQPLEQGAQVSGAEAQSAHVLGVRKLATSVSGADLDHGEERVRLPSGTVNPAVLKLQPDTVPKATAGRCIRASRWS